MTNSAKNVTSGEITADVAVIGGGGAGLSAAVTASEKGARVVVLESRRTPGGSSVLASGFFCPVLPGQKIEDITAQNDLFFKKALNYSHWKTNPRLIRALIEKSTDSVVWLERQGVRFQIDANYGFDQNRSMSRICGPGRGGSNVIKALVSKCEALGIPIITETRAQQLITDQGGRVIGVQADREGKELRFYSKSVVIATGGFGGNKELLKNYIPTFSEEDEIHLGGIPNQGDGLKMAKAVGAATDGNILLEMSMFIFPWSMHISIIAKRPEMVWFNKRGERFTDESIGFPDLVNTIFRQPRKVIYVILDSKTKDRILSETPHPMDYNMIPAGSWPGQVAKEIQEQVEKGRVKISSSWDEIAGWIGADISVLRKEIDVYNDGCSTGHDSIFAKNQKYLQPLLTPPYYVLKCCTNLLVTHGDLRVTPRMEVLDEQEKPIPGLYAAGDDTGDVDFGSYNFELPGHSFGFAINSGRIAGENAAAYLREKP